MITSYATLKTAVAGFLNRDDLTAIIPTFIQMAEATFNRKLRHFKMEARATAAFNEPFELLPTGWIETVRLSLDGKGPLKLLSSQEMMERKAQTWETGDPRFFSHTANQIELWPAPVASTGSGELVYYTQIPALSDSNASNWLLEDAPDLYLYGALIHSAPYLSDDPRIAVWGGLHADILASMNEQSQRQKFGGPLKMRMPANG